MHFGGTESNVKGPLDQNAIKVFLLSTAVQRLQMACRLLAEIHLASCRFICMVFSASLINMNNGEQRCGWNCQ